MAKQEKQYPDFECVEYDYGDLEHREYYGTIHATLKFADNVDIYVYFEFKEFLDHHKRKKTDFHRTVEKTYGQMSGWGSRYFELIELMQEDDDLDLFELFAEFIELTDVELAEKYEMRRYRIQSRPPNPIPVITDVIKESQKKQEKDEDKEEDEEDDEEEEDDEVEEKEAEEKAKTKVEEDDEEEDEESPYDRDRNKFHDLLKTASNDMFDALKVSFFPQMEYFQRRYPSKWKAFMETIESTLQNFEDEMLGELLPELDEDEYREFDIKYNSQQADMSQEDEPPSGK